MDGKSQKPSAMKSTAKQGNEEKVSTEEKTAVPTGAKRYKKGRVLESTIYGATRYGRDNVTKEWVIIKECLIEKVVAKRFNGQQTHEDVNMEIEVHRRLCQGQELCPYIVELKDVCQDSEYIYLILEYASGGDLYSTVDSTHKSIMHFWQTSSNEAEKLRRVEAWINDVRKWFRQILIALKFMHERNICHRDMSLENIVLSESRDVRVIDFGVGREYKDGNFSSEQMPIGKRIYMSPECFQQHYYDGRDNDMWCTGVILWTCLIGCPPWNFPSLQDKRFSFIMRGKIGVRELAKRWGRDFFVSEAATDLLSKIFRPEKDRIRVDEALRHPFITQQDELEPDLYIPTPENDFKRAPEQELSKKWRCFREKGHIIEAPQVWKKLQRRKKEDIQKKLCSMNKKDVCIFDRRLTRDLRLTYNLNIEEVHEILVYFMAASRNRIVMTDVIKSPKIVARKPSPVLQYHISENKAQESQISFHDNDNSSSKEEEKDQLVLRSKEEERHNLVLRTVFNDNHEDQAETHLLEVNKNLTLKQIKVEFSLLGMRTHNLPFISPKDLDLLLDGDELQDSARLRDGNVLRGQDLVPQWFRNLTKLNRQTCYSIYVSSNQNAQAGKEKQMFLSEVSAKFNVERAQCEDVWKYISLRQDLEFRDQIYLDGIAEECEWLKLLSNDEFGRDFALALGNIVIANIGDENSALALLEEEGLTCSKAVQAVEYFSQALQERNEVEESNPPNNE